MVKNLSVSHKVQAWQHCQACIISEVALA